MFNKCNRYIIKLCIIFRIGLFLLKMSSSNSMREIPISETLENLLTDVEFEYSDVTLEESTTTSTVPPS